MLRHHTPASVQLWTTATPPHSQPLQERKIFERRPVLQTRVDNNEWFLTSNAAGHATVVEHTLCSCCFALQPLV